MPHSRLNGVDTTGSLKKMPVTNTLTGTVYYRKSSLSDNLTRSGNQSVISGNINSSNASGKNVMAEQTVVSSTAPASLKSINQSLSSGKTMGDLSSNRPTLERSNATLQSQASSAAPDARASAKAAVAADHQQSSERPVLSTKPPTGPKEKPVHRQGISDRGQQHLSNKKKSGAPLRSVSDKGLSGSFDKRSVNKRGSLSTTAAHLEQRPLGDGAPARSSGNIERRGKLIGDCDEEGEDEFYEDDDYDDDEEYYQDGSSDASPSG